ncbi:SDR family oxidoreductase [Caulobacter sp. S45]|uniref:SDR family oxidoreductase n=1 Tax=Caulobacter sp. S45 TaxID=1641861 RepID=UPI00157570B0|nr:SDR family NAD(P)-dependent oxidoreductase [Caulobacter sp. S45]
MSSTGVDGRVALVTGASSGIGEATAEALARGGAKVVVAARRREKLDALVSRIAAAGGEAFALTADVSTPEAAAQMVYEAEAHHGRLDILVNNAGVMYLEPTAEADLGRWRHMLELNVLGLIAASQAALPGMRARQDGHIVNIASTAGRVANANSAGYSATKFGVVGFSEALRKELVKDRVRVTVVEPGIVETELRDHVAHEEARKAIEQFASSVRQLKSEDVANAILYAVSQPEHVCINEILMRPTDQER